MPRSTELSKQHGALIGMDEINSSKWKTATFDRYGIVSPRTTPTGKPSFAAGKSGWMGSHEHWLPRLIAVANKYDAAACKFLQGHIIDHIVNGRIHAETPPVSLGRRRREIAALLVFSDPPLQQMPIRDKEIGPLIRRVFLPDEGHRWAKPDVSQQEFRILVDSAEQHDLPGAREAGDAYRNNPKADFHQVVADMTGLDRDTAKAVNFAKIYGGGAARIAETTGKSLAEAQAIIAQYDAKLPFVSKLVAHLPEPGRTHRDHRAVWRCATALEQIRGALEGLDVVLTRRGTAPRRRSRASLVRPGVTSRQDLHGLERPDSRLGRDPHQAVAAGLLARGHRADVADARRAGKLGGDARAGRDDRPARRRGREAHGADAGRLEIRPNWGDAKHSWEELSDASINGAAQHSETLAAPPIELPPDPATLLPASLPSEATTQIDPPDSNEQPVPLHCLDGDTSRTANRTRLAKVTGTTKARRPNRRPARRSRFTRFG